MAKRKFKATLHVVDGIGGMVPITDLRFEAGDWPIRDDIPADLSDDWFAHIDAECSERGWSSHGVSQQETNEHSGTFVISTGTSGRSAALELVWERPRGGPISFRARSAGSPVLPLDEAREFLDAICRRCRAGTIVHLHRRAHLIYDGLPWRGELWLENNLRLGPASRRASWLVAPQVIIVDAEVEGIGWQGVNSSFDLLLRELSIFMSVVLGVRATREKSGWAWTYESDSVGNVANCDLRPLGYLDAVSEMGMPQAGEAPPIPMRSVQRPGLERSGIWPEDVEQEAPQDILELWQEFKGLNTEKRTQFLKAGNAYQIACSMWPDQRTAWVAFMVVACESLKPAGNRYDKCNIYDVVEGLLGTSEAHQLRQLELAPQKVRSGHLHRGELAAGELVPILRQTYFGDSSFYDTASELAKTTRTCIIEWLRKRGSYALNCSSRKTHRRDTR